jgi:hypothetical protein
VYGEVEDFVIGEERSFSADGHTPGGARQEQQHNPEHAREASG